MMLWHRLQRLGLSMEEALKEARAAAQSCLTISAQFEPKAENGEMLPYKVTEMKMNSWRLATARGR